MIKKAAEAQDVDLSTERPPVAEHPLEIEDGTIIDYFPTLFDKTAHTKPGEGYTRRPNGDAVLAVVLHIGKGTDFAGEALRLARAHKESAHYLIGVPADQVVPVAAIVPPYLMAHHCGASMGYGYYDWDQYSVGIVVQVAEDATELHPRQWAALTWLVKMLKRHYPSITFITRHSMIAQSEKPVDDQALGDAATFEKWVQTVK